MVRIINQNESLNFLQQLTIIDVPVYCNACSHVDRTGHCCISGRIEVWNHIGKDIIRPNSGQGGHGEEEKGAQ